MNIKNLQGNNISFNGKVFIAPSLRKVVNIKPLEDYDLFITKMPEAKGEPSKLAINLVKEGTGKVLKSLIWPNKPDYIRVIPEAVQQYLLDKKRRI